MRGVVKNIVGARGFGFVKAESGEEYFFHRTTVKPRHAFNSMMQGDKVTFDVEPSDKGPRAVHVELAFDRA